jgi:predicted  nucleic acid-binding Zn-ribbon protein
MIRLPKTKIHNSIDKIDEHLDVIYQLKNAFVEVDKDVLINLSDSIDTWKSCISELEFEINSVNTIEHELEDNNTEEELIIY